MHGGTIRPPTPAVFMTIKASSCKTHRVQLRRAEGHEVWRGDRLIGLRDWVGEVYLYMYSILLIVFMTLLTINGPDKKRNGDYCMFRADANSGRDC